ncbi:MAG: class I SAM-dependent methyltransferase [bacterium]|nr:class I SAM-dependent methyltransferase [bacterium]
MEMEDKILRDIENGYDLMVEKFSNTRKYFWRDFEFIRGYIPDDGKILDFGCGNGRFLEMLKDRRQEYFGVDVSQKLIDIAKEKYAKEGVNFQKISSSDILPFPDNFFNSVVSISVFHHFPSGHAQRMAKEIYRVTKPGGMVIISVWNLWQKRYWKYWLNPKNLWEKNINIPFKNNQEEIFNRFHHMFRKKELEKLFWQAGFQIEKSLVLNKKNIIIIGKKI